MTFTVSLDPTPLRVHENGTVYVGSTRVMLELVIEAYQAGNSAEQIVEIWDVLKLSDVHRVIAYYLEHHDDVEAYMRQQEARGQLLREENEKRYPSTETRAYLLKKLQDKGIDPFPDNDN